jgi:DNA polymerase-3 subunit epsilon
LTARPALPSQLDPRALDDLPSTHGVYLFFGENDLPLYIGKANNLRQRVLSHFSGDHQSDKELEMSQQIRRVEWIETAGEIGALLKEAALIKERLPAYNAQLRRNEEMCSWRLVRSAAGARLRLAQPDDLFFGLEGNLYGLYANARKAHAALLAIADANRLCPALLGLEKVSAGKPCFSNQVKRCMGACVGTETAAAHADRLAHALEPIRLQDWPYPGPIGISEGFGHVDWTEHSECAPPDGKTQVHVIDNWNYLGSANSDDEVRELLDLGRRQFEHDTYKILQKRLPRLALGICAYSRGSSVRRLTSGFDSHS